MDGRAGATAEETISRGGSGCVAVEEEDSEAVRSSSGGLSASMGGGATARVETAQSADGRGGLYLESFPRACEAMP
jgi:hypothetical protein